MPSYPPSSDIALHLPFLKEIASKSSVIIEIGAGHGNGSTRAFAAGLARSPLPEEDKLFISVDADPSRPDEKPDLPYYHVVHGWSQQRSTVIHVIKLLKITWPDIIFIDTNHTYEQISMELDLWSSIAGRNTVWLMHDTYMWGTYNPMTDAIKEFASKNDWVYETLTEECHGLGAMRRKGHAIPVSYK